jgi:hypothetical protein
MTVEQKAANYANHTTFVNVAEKQIVEISFISGANWQASQHEWVSVKDRLPEKDGISSIYCLVYETRYGQRVLPYNEYHECWDQEDGDDFYSTAVGGKITHWMPLPEPPKTEI